MDKIGLILMFTWKFAFTFPIAIYINKLTFFHTILIGNIGGILGVIGFAYLSDFLIKLWQKHINQHFTKPKQKRKKFTKRNRRIVLIKTRYGLPGIVVLNPVILSIPVSTFLIRKYYGDKILNLGWLILGQVAWSFIYTYFYFFIKTTI